MNEHVTIEEIDKWLIKIEEIVPKIEVVEPRGQGWYTNMKAYISDSKHFRDEGDLVRGFEAVVWAWAIFEICVDLGVFAIDK
ncbi:MAG: DUF357 domain-containing protein [Candidatus Aenigmarchaeota archaeon]|nr:DUF357 domain-containing protein [Candidatus Aenigmarchaeota archaeon]